MIQEMKYAYDENVLVNSASVVIGRRHGYKDRNTSKAPRKKLNVKLSNEAPSDLAV